MIVTGGPPKPQKMTARGDPVGVRAGLAGLLVIWRGRALGLRRAREIEEVATGT
jgi:hypothetical protein